MKAQSALRVILALTLALLVLAFPLGRLARAAVTGSIEGTVVDAEKRKPLAGVTVTVTGPALQGEQTDFTDAHGHYLITELPPGAYLVRFYFSNVVVERGGIVLNADKTLQVDAQVPFAGAVKTYRVVERSPTVDIGSQQVQSQITEEMTRNAPIPGGFQGRRNYDSVLGMVPGALGSSVAGGGDVNPTFSGSIGNENKYLIDGINTTQTTQGFLGTQLTLEFVRETDVVTAGYNAEYGGATGAIINVITKSGSNKFHGGAWLFALPYQLYPPATAGNREALAFSTKRQWALDFGFDLGGPIWKDKIWFFVGFTPSLSRDDVRMAIQRRLGNNINPNQMMGTYPGDTMGGVPACPRYLASSALCPGAQLFRFQTQELGGPNTTHTQYDRAIYNAILKLDFRLGSTSNLSASYIASPTLQNGIGGGAGDTSTRNRGDLDNIQDVGLHFISKLLDHRLQIDALLGWHWERYNQYFAAGGEQPVVTYQGTKPLTAFRDIPDCAVQMVHGVTFNPCPITGYQVGGIGSLDVQTTQRISATAAATYFLKAAGTHAFKLGFEFEDSTFENRPYYSGGVRYRILTNGNTQERLYATVDAAGNVTPQPNGIVGSTFTYNETAYLRDSWNVGFLPGLTINAGLRWEGLQAHAANGSTAFAIFDNVAPRVGFAWDFTRKGLSKIFANYGRYYEVVALGINDNQFANRGLSNYVTASPGSCRNDPATGLVIIDTCTFRPLTANDIVTGSYAKVQPKLGGEFIHEVVAGVSYDVGLDIVLGAAYIHREIGRVIDSAAPLGDGQFIIGNPGADQSDAIADLKKQIASTTDPTRLRELQYTLQQVEGLATMAAPKRNYDAMQLTASKRLTHNFIVDMSYVYSRTLGNYTSSLASPNSTGLYGNRILMVNADGPLPNDRPHNFKFRGGYVLPIGKNTLNFGAGVSVVSGAPINVLGIDAQYGSTVYILPRGSGGRLPSVSSIDLHLGYGRDLPHKTRVDISFDVFNVANFQEVTAVDNTWTTNTVSPILGGKVANLKNLRATDGSAVVINPNYGQPTAYQAPLNLRLGARVSF